MKIVEAHHDSVLWEAGDSCCMCVGWSESMKEMARMMEELKASGGLEGLGLPPMPDMPGGVPGLGGSGDVAKEMQVKGGGEALEGV
jgi:hypothetical protein